LISKINAYYLYQGLKMNFSHIRRSFLFGILLSLPFLNPQPAKAFLALPEPVYSEMSPVTVPPEHSAPLRQAIALLEQAKYTEADIILRSLIQASPTDMPARDFYHTSQLLQGNWLNLAIENADRAYQNLPSIRFPNPREGIVPTINLPDAIDQKINQLDWGATPDLSGAIAQVKQQVTQNPDAIPPRLTLASLYILDSRKPGEAQSTAKFQQAQEQMRELIRRHPDDAQLQLILADNLSASNEKTAAYQESIRLNPQLVQAWIGYSKNAIDTQKDLSQVMMIFEDGIRANPNSFQLQHYAGYTLLTMQRPDEAIAYLDQAASLRPDAMFVWSGLFLALSQANYDQTNLMLDALERVATLNPSFTAEDINSLANISSLNLSMVSDNRIPELVTFYNRIGRKNPKVASMGFSYLGFLLTEVAPSKGDRIIRLYRRAYALDPSREHLRQLASALIRNRQPIEGEALLRHFLADEPPGDAVYARGELAFAMAQQDANRALKYLDEIYAIDPTSSGYEWIGGWLVEQKRWDEAKVFYERAVRQDPWYNIFLAQILAEQGQTDEAIAKLQTVLSNIPKEDPNYYGLPSAVLCDVLAKAGRLEEAIARYEEAIDYNEALAQRSKNPSIYYEFGEFLQRHQRWEQAIGQYRLAAQVADEQQNPLLVAMSHRGIGQILAALRQMGEAQVELEQARSMFQEMAYIDLAAETQREMQAFPVKPGNESGSD
jgi:tetratricopeptide (TPR) repeat protein